MAIEFKKPSEVALQQGLKALVYGSAGSGKTVLCTTGDHPTLIISAEGGLLSIRDVPGDITVTEVHNLEEVGAVYQHLLKDDHYKTVALDSGTEIAEQCLFEELKKSGKDPRKAYGELIQKMSSLIRLFRDLPGKDVIMTAKIERIADDSSRLLYSPAMPGAKLGAALFRAARTGGKKQGNRWNLCNSSPIANLLVAGGELGEEREIHTFHPDELQAIYAEEPETASIWEFCVNTGLRQAEARHQLQRYVDKGSDLPQCRLVHNPKKGLILKGKRQRMIPLTDAAQEARDRITHGRGDDERFMLPQSRSWWGHHFVRVARRAGVEEGTFNSLRHTFISRAANCGNIPIDVVRSWAGHRYLKTTQNYLHTLPDVEHKYVQQLKI